MIEQEGPGAVVLGEQDRAPAVAAVKAVLRVGTTDEDDLIAALAQSALGLAEQFLGALTLVRPLRETLPVSAAWQRLGAAPVRAISALETIDGVALATTAFAIDIDAAGNGWVRVTDAGDARQIVAPYTAGLADGWADLPAGIRQGAALLAAYLFDQRDAAAVPPAAVTALWRPFRRIDLIRGTRPC